MTPLSVNMKLFPPPPSALGHSSTLRNTCDCIDIWDKAALQELPSCSSWGTLFMQPVQMPKICTAPFTDGEMDRRGN